jgi:phosphohistidine phosphatase
MIKTLILVRHGKAEKRESSEGDISRPLTDEGKSETTSMAGFLKESGIIPDKILSSTAKRARQTAEIFLKTYSIDPSEFKSEVKLYYANARTILNHVYGTEKGVICLLLVAHNPGISDLVRGLSSGSELFMETSEAAVFKYRIEHWHQLGDKEPESFRAFKVADIKKNTKQ